MPFIKNIFFSVIFLLAGNLCIAQKDSLRIMTGGIVASKGVAKGKDSTAKKYNPGIAIKRSAILPGWGQYTNKKYWKLPLVYGALGTTGYLFFRNLKQYKEAKTAYTLATDGDATNDYLIKEPYHTVLSQPERIRTFRNSVRQNVDYSVLFFVIFWGLNVADAAVDAHLKTFDVSDDLSLQFKGGYSPMANTTGVSLVLNIGK
jgi:hypothetical protein